MPSKSLPQNMIVALTAILDILSDGSTRDGLELRNALGQREIYQSQMQFYRQTAILEERGYISGTLSTNAHGGRLTRAKSFTITEEGRNVLGSPVWTP